MVDLSEILHEVFSSFVIKTKKIQYQSFIQAPTAVAKSIHSTFDKLYYIIIYLYIQKCDKRHLSGKADNNVSNCFAI